MDFLAIKTCWCVAGILLLLQMHFVFSNMVVLFLHLLYIALMTREGTSLTHSDGPWLCPRTSHKAFFGVFVEPFFPSWRWGLLNLLIPDCVTFLCFPMLQNVRVQLQESLPGTGGGKNSSDELLVKFLYLLPLLVIAFCYYRSFLQVSIFKKSYYLKY